ncbi:hypothetical protein D0Z00_000313 [Geotrichum galactomycetum]|uniref:Uncharacterized protein n=1 Tax=Geotrichum galactomycetum TaxID=27317 RepID=A0ACB6VA80_9ASCO|nr:hypothetical protein D0Z00_000313 [Geotrichum candidum]
MTATSQDSKLNIQFLPLTGEVSAPFIPQSIKSLREEYINSEETMDDGLLDDSLAHSLKHKKERALSDASDVVLPEPLHTRADSS